MCATNRRYVRKSFRGDVNLVEICLIDELCLKISLRVEGVVVKFDVIEKSGELGSVI